MQTERGRQHTTALCGDAEPTPCTQTPESETRPPASGSGNWVELPGTAQTVTQRVCTLRCNPRVQAQCSSGAQTTHTWPAQPPRDTPSAPLALHLQARDPHPASAAPVQRSRPCPSRSVFCPAPTQLSGTRPGRRSDVPSCSHLWEDARTL